MVEWQQLGVYVGLSRNELDRITYTTNLPSPADKLLEVLKTRMNKLPEPSWPQVVQAVAKIGRESLAKKIALKYGKTIGIGINT